MFPFFQGQKTSRIKKLLLKLTSMLSSNRNQTLNHFQALIIPKNLAKNNPKQSLPCELSTRITRNTTTMRAARVEAAFSLLLKLFSVPYRPGPRAQHDQQQHPEVVVGK